MLDARRKLMVTTHIAGARLFPRLASMVEKSHRGFVRVVFDGMVAAITSQVDALIRDLHMVVPGKIIEVQHQHNLDRRGSSSSSSNGTSKSSSVRGERDADDDGDDRGEKVRERQECEAEQFPEFAARLKARIAVAERVMFETRGVVEEVRSLAVEEMGRGRLECGHWVPVPVTVAV